MRNEAAAVSIIRSNEITRAECEILHFIQTSLDRICEVAWVTFPKCCGKDTEGCHISPYIHRKSLWLPFIVNLCHAKDKSACKPQTNELAMRGREPEYKKCNFLSHSLSGIVVIQVFLQLRQSRTFLSTSILFPRKQNQIQTK